MHIFTYGTLMFPEVWQSIVGRSYATVAGRAPGFAIYRVRDAVFPGIVVAADSSVHGLVYLDVEAESVATLDRFEDDFYRREAVTVVCDDGHERAANCYVVPADARNVLTDEPWSAAEFVARGDLARFVRGFAGFQRASGRQR